MTSFSIGAPAGDHLPPLSPYSSLRTHLACLPPFLVFTLHNPLLSSLLFVCLQLLEYLQSPADILSPSNRSPSRPCFIRPDTTPRAPDHSNSIPCDRSGPRVHPRNFAAIVLPRQPYQLAQTREAFASSPVSQPISLRIILCASLLLCTRILHFRGYLSSKSLAHP